MTEAAYDPDQTIDERLVRALEDYCQQASAGADPDPDAYLNRHPDLEDDLTDCLEGLAAMEELRRVLSGPVPGSRSLGDYEVQEELGRGGMGVVYRARQVRLGRLVALKMIRAADMASELEVERFRNEAAIVAQLDHPNIVPVYEVGENEGQVYYSMKLIEGGGLADRPERFGSDPRGSARLLITVARAVHHAHQRGILHRDLKPSNILLDREGNPHVTDFGLAKRITTDSNLTQSGTLVGTPSYMAPEQTSGQRGLVTTATDVYGLGGILYALLTGSPPCEGETLLETLDQVRGREPARPGAVNAKVDRDLETITLKCLRKEPTQRYESAEALARDLERWLAGQPIKARPVGRVERVWRWCRRHPALAGATVAAAALALAVTIKALSVAHDRAARLEREVLRSNRYAARGVASTVLWQLERLSEPVTRTRGDARLRQLLAAADEVGLQKFLDEVRQRYDAPGAGLVQPDEPSPFRTWYVLDGKGRLLAVSPPPEDPTLIGRDFSGRDYFQGAMRRAGESGRSAVHISRVFRAENLDLYKFALSVAIRDPGKPDAPPLGVLAATITTTSTLGSLRLHDGRHTAVLVGRKDTNPPRGAAPEQLPEEYVILLHPAYRPGQEAVRVAGDRLSAVCRTRPGDEFQLPGQNEGAGADEAMDAHYEDPVAATDREYAGRWLAGFAPVGNTEFVVIVQQRYDEVVESDQKLLLDLLLWVGVALLLGLLCVGGLVWYGVRRGPNIA
ncbi:MAG: serine/threonine protein kinase [Gemmataceae bacterium]|nr:serine/threonine protein kinase [Gemmataceae bacterium]